MKKGTSRENGTENVTVTKKDADGVHDIKKDSRIIAQKIAEWFPNLKHVPDDERVQLSIGMGVTRNMDNYESARVDVWLTIPCSLENVQEAYSKVRDYVEAKLVTEQEEMGIEA